MSEVQRRYGNRATQHAMRFPQLSLFPRLTRIDRAYGRWLARRGGCCGACGGRSLHRVSCPIGFQGVPAAPWQLIQTETKP